MKKLNIILLIIWLLTIFMFSCDNSLKSSSKSDGIAKTLVNIISDITGKNFEGSDFEDILNTCVFIVRKTAHFLEYFILGILVINVMKDYIIIDKKHLIYSILLCMLYSISDEVHQLFVPGRSCQIRDILIDSCGSLLSIYGYYHIFLKKKYLLQGDKNE